MACTGHIDLLQFQQEYGIMVLVTVCDLLLPMFIVLLTAAVTVMCAFFSMDDSKRDFKAVYTELAEM